MEEPKQRRRSTLRRLRTAQIDGNQSTSSSTLLPHQDSIESAELLKVVVIGDSGGGKSNLIQRLVKNRFEERSASTIGIDFALYDFTLPVPVILGSSNGKSHHRKKSTVKQILVDKTHRAQIWDTAGQERYKSSMTKIFYRDVLGALLVFDLTQREHFESLPRWLREIRSNVHHMDERCHVITTIDPPIILVGNKVDRASGEDSRRAVSQSEAIQFARRNRLAEYVETSAKTGENVQHAFLTLFRAILDQQHQQQAQHPSGNDLDSNRSSSPSKHGKNVQREQSIKLTQDRYYLQQRREAQKHTYKSHKSSKCAC